MRNRWHIPAALCAFLAVGTFTAPLRAAETDKYLPNKTQAVITLNVKQLLDAPLVKDGIDQVKALLQIVPEVKKATDDLGFDPFKDLERVVFAGMGGADSDKGLILLHGNFDVTKFQAALAKAAKDNADAVKEVKAGDYKIYEVSSPNGGAETLLVAVIDKDTIAASPDKDTLIEALDKKAGKKNSELNKDLQGLLGKVDPKQSLTIAALTEGIDLGALGGALNQKLKNVTGGITVAEDIKAEFAFAAKDVDSAKAVAKGLSDGLNQAKALVAVIVTQQKELAPIADVLTTIKVSPKGSDVAVRAQLTKEFLEKLFKQDN